MLKALRGRVDRKDEGFTLIELMVVVLIIGILMAIAIPTFLGAKSGANDRSVQENARNALTAEKEYFSNNQAYTASNTALTALEPNLSYPSGSLIKGSNQVQPVVAATNGGTNDNVLLTVYSNSGTCFYIDDEAIAPTGSGPAAGTYYGSAPSVSGACPAATVPTSTPTAAHASGTLPAAGANWGLAW